MSEEPLSTNYAARAAFHARAAQAVCAKVQKLYGLSAAQITLPDAPWVKQCGEQLHAALGDSYWQSARDDVLTRSNLPDAAKQIDAIAYDIMQRYAQSFYMNAAAGNQRKSGVPSASRGYVAQVEPAYILGEIHTNHVSNQAEAALAAAGLNAHDAHQLHSKLIGMVISNYKQCAPSAQLRNYADVRPTIGSASNKSPEEMDGRIERIRERWRKASNLLEQHHRDFTSGWSR